MNFWKGAFDPGGETGARPFLGAPGTSGGAVVVTLSDWETSGEERESPPEVCRERFLVTDMFTVTRGYSLGSGDYPYFFSYKPARMCDVMSRVWRDGV